MRWLCRLALGLVMYVFLIGAGNRVYAADYYLCTYGNGSYYVMTETIDEVSAAASYAYAMKVKFVPTNYPDERRLLDVTLLYKKNQWLILRDGGTYKVSYNYDYSGLLKDYIVKKYNLPL